MPNSIVLSPVSPLAQEWDPLSQNPLMESRARLDPQEGARSVTARQAMDTGLLMGCLSQTKLTHGMDNVFLMLPISI